MEGFKPEPVTLVKNLVASHLEIIKEGKASTAPLKGTSTESPRRLAVRFHTFAPEQIRKVSNNHKNENLLFRRLLGHRQYTLRPTSKPSNPQSLTSMTATVQTVRNSDYRHHPFNPLKLSDNLTWIVDCLERVLGSCQNYELGEQLKLVKSEKKHLVLRSEAEEVAIPPLSSMTPSSFLALITASKESSLKIQDLIAEVDESHLHLLESLVVPNLATLLHHRYGIYPLTKLIEKSSKVQRSVERWALENFESFVVNEFGSKMLQKLASLSQEFRKLTLQALFKNWATLSENISSVFYLGYVMKISEDKAEFSRVKDCVRQQIDHQQPLRYNKRILVSFTRYCANEDLDSVFELIKHRYLLQEVLNDVYFALCLSILLTRDHLPAKCWILEQSTPKLFKLLKIKHFRSLCETIMTDMPFDFQHKFLLSIKKFAVEFATDQVSLYELPPFFCFALWLVLKHLGVETLRQDAAFGCLVVLLFKREFSRRTGHRSVVF